ncbi:DUF354 domain-containing protein [Melioribacter sp. OK-6-Me]|uniref:DUF354 domain-containing protein n=1 Tax=Melioribacter sp. OK-6-Me TaxID=3423433 RepID=UPI003EDA6376
MRILIDIGHPAHVHYYRNLAIELEKKGHSVFWTVKDVPVIKQLLEAYGFKYTILSNKSDQLIGKIIKQIFISFSLLKFCWSNKIDIGIGTSATLPHLSKLSNMKSIVLDDDDDDVQPLITRFVNPFADVLLSPAALKYKRKRKDTIYYAGYHELAYLHPNRFTPDPSVLKDIGIKQGEPFFIMRFNVFKAHHDIGVKGLALENKIRLVDLLKTRGKVFITTEREIEPELAPYQLKISPEKIHSLMYYATMFIGDSQTMTSEAAILGTPAIKCNSFAGRLSVPNEIENKYGLCFSFKPENFDRMINKIKELLTHNDLKKEWCTKRDSMIKEKIDVTALLFWLIEEYPNSFKELLKNPDIQYQFK